MQHSMPPYTHWAIGCPEQKSGKAAARRQPTRNCRMHACCHQQPAQQPTSQPCCYPLPCCCWCRWAGCAGGRAMLQPSASRWQCLSHTAALPSASLTGGRGRGEGGMVPCGDSSWVAAGLKAFGEAEHQPQPMVAAALHHTRWEASYRIVACRCQMPGQLVLCLHVLSRTCTVCAVSCCVLLCCSAVWPQ